MENIFDKIRAELPGGGELALEAMDEYQLLEIGRKTYECCRSLMRNPEYRKMIEEEAARIQEEEARKSTSK